MAQLRSPSILIRADGGGPLGFGHLRRCTTLANALVESGIRTTWLTANPDLLPADLDPACTRRTMSASEEQPQILETARDTQASLVIGDWQETRADLVSALRKAGLKVALVGNHTGDARADLYLRQRFEPGEAQSDAINLDGADHLLLPGVYHRPVQESPHRHARMLLTFGGSGNERIDALRKSAQASAERLGLDIDLMQPKPGDAPLTQAAISERMSAADFGVLAAGTALHEAAAMRLPCIVIPITSNQRDRAGSWQRLGFGLTITPTNANWAGELDRAIRQMAQSLPIRLRASARMAAQIDGAGAERAAAALTRLAAGTPAAAESH